MLALILAVSNPLHPLEVALRHVLFWLHDSIGFTWAWAIVALTVMVRMLLVPLTVRQIHSMQSLQRHAPQMKENQRKYKADKQKQQEELMKFYRENNINPAASCLPLLAQFPVFIALYYTLRHFNQHPPGGQAAVAAGDFSWLHFVPDITVHTNSFWGGYILLVVYVASQMASSLYMSATADKTQRALFMLMPLVFVFVIAHFPVGLVLYWLTTNLWTVGQGLITRRLIPRTAAPPLSFGRASPRRSDGDGGSGGERAARKPEPPKPAPKASQPQTPRRVKRKKKARR
jgi:YidC/Oxa1 family membrane protein insertase